MNVLVDGQPVALPPGAFVAAGGEGALYAVGDVAYKVFFGPVDADRLRALAGLVVPGAALPQRLIHNTAGEVIGHTMRHVAQATPWSRLASRRFRQDAGVGPDRLALLIGRLRDRVAAAHAAGALVVDLHEGNVLLDATLQPVLVDTSSWQLPAYPATAIADLVRDRHATGFGAGTDWFAFAVTACATWLGVHPYRGHHPTLPDLDARMRARVSVLDPAVRRPPMAGDPASLPALWRDWLRAVLDGDHRGPPPTGAPSPAPWTPAPARPGRLTARPLATASATIRDAWRHDGRLHTHTGAGAATTTVDGTRWTATCHQGLVQFAPLGGPPIAAQVAAHTVRRLGHGFVTLGGDQLVAWTPRGPVALPRLLARVSPQATALFDGVAVQALLGATHVSLLAPDRCVTVPVPALDGHVVIDAVALEGAAVLLGRREGRTRRVTLRARGAAHDVHVDDDVDEQEVGLAVLPTGVAVAQHGTALHLFRAHPGDAERRVVDAPELLGGRVLTLGGEVGFARGASVAILSL